MLILNEHLRGYACGVEKKMAETGPFVIMAFSNYYSDMSFGMSIEQAKQMLESLKEALKDE